MKRTNRLMVLAVLLLLLLSGCGDRHAKDGEGTALPWGTSSPDIGGFDDSFGEALTDTEVYDGYFTEATEEMRVLCISGTQGAYRIEGETLYFTALSEDSIYAISGQWKGNVIVDIGDAYRLDLELRGFSLVSENACPMEIRSGNKVSLTAKKNFVNYIYDVRAEISTEDSSTLRAAVASTADLEICGKGRLTVLSENNHGIHSKDDLEVQNLTLFVSCADNALKGNDSVEITAGSTTLIATRGDGIKTDNTDVSEKGNQRGTVSILGGTHTVYAACDGIDAAYDVVIDDASTVLKIYTDKYSNYSEEVTAVDSDEYFIRCFSDAYAYSVQYYNSDGDTLWVDATYHSMVSGEWSSYYYYSFPRNSSYAKIRIFIYTAEMLPGQATDYAAATDYLTPSAGYDTFALVSRGGSLSYQWTNYTTKVEERPGGPGGFGGPGGMQDGNTDKGDFSTKGIKAANEIRVLQGSVTVKAYDDALHAGGDALLENGNPPLGSVVLSGGTLTVYSNDDGVHADGTLSVTGGSLQIVSSYEGLEGSTVSVTGGSVSVLASDDGINSTATTGVGIVIGGGRVYVFSGGDGMDANSRTSYEGIVFSGGQTVVISTSGGNSALDTEAGYGYTGGVCLALMPAGGMTNEATHGQNFQSIGTEKSITISAGEYLTVRVERTDVLTLCLPKSLSGRAIFLGSNEASFSTSAKGSESPDANGVAWH